MEKETLKGPIEQVEAVVASFEYKEIRNLLKKERKGRSAWLKDWEALPDSDKKKECETALNFPEPGEKARASEMTRIEAVMEVLNPYLSEEQYQMAVTIFDRLLNKVRKADDPQEAHLDLHYEVFEEQEGKWIYNPQKSRTPIVPLMKAVLGRCVQELGWPELVGEPDEKFLNEVKEIIRVISEKNKEAMSGYDPEREVRKMNTEALLVQSLISDGSPYAWPSLLREDLSSEIGELPAIEGVPIFELRGKKTTLRLEDFPPGYRFGDYEVVSHPEPKSGAARRVFFAEGKKGEMVAIGVFGHKTLEEQTGYMRYFAIKGAREDFVVELVVRKAVEGNEELFPLIHPLVAAGKIIWRDGEEKGVDDFYFTIEPFLKEGEEVFTIRHSLFNPELLSDFNEATREIFTDQQKKEAVAAQYLLDLFSLYDYFLNAPVDRQAKETIIVPRDIKFDQVYFKVAEDGRIRPYFRDFNLFKLVPAEEKARIVRELSEDFNVIRQTAEYTLRAFTLTELGETKKGSYYTGGAKEGTSLEMRRFIAALQELDKTWIGEIGGETDPSKTTEEVSSGFTYAIILALMEKSGLIEKTAEGYRVKERFTY